MTVFFKQFEISNKEVSVRYFKSKMILNNEIKYSRFVDAQNYKKIEKSLSELLQLSTQYLKKQL